MASLSDHQLRLRLLRTSRVGTLVQPIHRDLLRSAKNEQLSTVQTSWNGFESRVLTPPPRKRRMNALLTLHIVVIS